MAQEVPPGARFTIGIENRLEAGRNLALETPPAGDTVLGVTVLTFGFLSETRTERLAVDFDGRLRIGRDEDERVSGFEDSGLSFSYTRQSANELLGVEGRVRSADVSTFRFLDDPPPGIDEDEFDELIDALTGIRREFGLDGRLELGRAGPLGFTFTASRSGVRHRNTGDSDLTDSDTTSLGVSSRLRFSQVLTGTVGLSRTRLRERSAIDDAFLRRQSTDRLDLGLVYDVSPRLQVDGGLGLVRIDTREPESRSRDEGIEARLAAALDMPDGTLSGEVTRSFTEDGARYEFRITRLLERPDGALEVSLGVAQPQDGGTALVGGASWRRELPTGEISARLSRELASTDVDETRLLTLAGLDFSQEITAVSSFAFGIDYGVRSAGGGDPRRELGSISATYSHQLTADWALNAGLTYRTEREAGARRSTSPSVFIGLGRQFDFGL